MYGFQERISRGEGCRGSKRGSLEGEGVGVPRDDDRDEDHAKDDLVELEGAHLEHHSL